jgi:hypothetical protein
MEDFVFDHFKKKSLFLIISLVFILLSVWWVTINFLLPNAPSTASQIFAASYQILAILGAGIGFLMTKKWGGYKSLLGKSLFLFSLGLLLQSFGQSVYSYYIFFRKIEVPYPSIGDVGYFGSVIAYVWGAVYLSKIAGFRTSWKSIQNKFYVIIIPIILIGGSYLLFLNGYQFDWSNKLKIFLDFGYPLGEALYVSIAVVTLIISKNILGGVMRKSILLLIFALIVQYCSDTMFLYQANAGTWVAGGLNDYLYCVSYFLMTISLIYIGSMFAKIQNS